MSRTTEDQRADEKKAPSKTLGWATFGLLTAYCVLEAAYNLGLMSMLSSTSATVGGFESLERVGTALGSFGLALFAARAVGGRVGLAVLLIGTPAIYVGLDRAIDAWLESLPPERRAASYFVGAYRMMNNQGVLTDPSLAGMDEASRQVAMANLPLVLKDPSSAARGALDWTLEPLSAADSSSGGSFEVACKSYKDSIEPLNSLWPVYAMESRRWSDLPSGGRINDYIRTRYATEFEKKVGVPPGLDKEGFVQALLRSHPQAAAAMSAEIVPGRPDIGVPALRVSDIPPGLDVAGCRSFFAGHARDSVAKARSAAADVSSRADWKRVVSGSEVPPVSMTLSLFSLTLNGVAAVALLTGLLLGRERAASLVGAPLGFAVCVALWSSAPPAFKGGAEEGRVSRLGSVTGGSVLLAAQNAEKAFIVFAGEGAQAASAKLVSLVPHQGGAEAAQRIEVRQVGGGAVDARALAEKFAGLGALSGKKSDVVADESKIDERGYYGEARTSGGNPYAKP